MTMTTTMTMKLGMIGLAVATATWAGGTALGQNAPAIRYQPEIDSPIAERNPNAPPAMANYDFVAGDWDVEIEFTPPGGQPNRYAARWHNHWIVNGMVMMQEWRGPYATGTEIRFFNPANDRIEGVNIYPAFGGGARATHSHWQGDRMEVVIPSEDAEGAFLNRETYLDITATSFRMYSERSRDDGETWSAGTYEMTATRIEP